MTRRRRRRGPETPGPAGFLVVDKPPGWTSHDVVDAARAWLGTRRVGHLGTLDPLATGVLPLAVREATKLVPFLESGLKTYAGTVRLGEETDTYDAEGSVVRRHDGKLPAEEELRAALLEFTGETLQVPPMFSAVKRDGVPLHRLAREGREVDRPPKRVRIDRLDLLRYAPPDLEIEVVCTPGTYVRALASDLGRRLSCGGHLRGLRRTRSGPFEIEGSAPPERLEQEARDGSIAARLIHPATALDFPVLRLRPEEAARVIHGEDLVGPRLSLVPGARVSALAPGGDLLAVLELQPGRRLRPLRVLRSLAPQR